MKQNREAKASFLSPSRYRLLPKIRNAFLVKSEDVKRKNPECKSIRDFFGTGVHNGLALVLGVSIQPLHYSPTGKIDLLAQAHQKPYIKTEQSKRH